MSDSTPNFDRFIERDRKAQRVYLYFSVLLILGGIALVLVSFLQTTEQPGEWQSLGLKIGGAFVSSLSGFPLKEYLARADRIHGVQAVKEMWLLLTAQPSTSKADLDRINDIIWKLYEKGAVG